MNEETEAQRMLRAQREWERASRQGDKRTSNVWEYATTDLTTGKIILLSLCALIIIVVAGTVVEMIVDPEGYAEREAQYAASKQAEINARKLVEHERQAAENEQRNKGLHCLSKWDGSNRSTVRQVKEMLREPSSFEHVETAIYPNDNGEHGLWMKYRARNGFGGMNVESIYARVDHETCEARVLPNGPGSPVLGSTVHLRRSGVGRA
ncbi:hypothetical protein PYV00_07005 [Novosphingobium sp. H3SJ31-1]|uniref:Uncharacterized protein n=1 Tax=Novosphingobium album (ex Liu et al. 2023) TaxID=3031130 RepID=A0ABT5WN44_9SPHN|nr:hypothetical protein [Novosphingobium album (ex Liu et al. 2023)]